jgi:mono/diheme cytochrome c family protein
VKSSRLWLLLTLALPVALLAAEKTIQLPEDNRMAELKLGEGVEVTRKDCVACHSTDYIVRQPGRDAQQWQAEVAKMITVYGAQISEQESKAIASYLASCYGAKPKTGNQKSVPGR